MSNYTHGGTHTRLYSIWKSMKGRCSIPNWKPYARYGGRGIKVCEEWQNSYDAFKDWAVSHSYAADLELDRINVNGDYTPDNCRWITHHEQTLNRRDTLYCLIDGEKYRLRDYCDNHGINYHSVNDWRHKGCLEQKLSAILSREVVIIGGKKNDT